MKSTANTGFMINATIKDAVNVKMSIVGKYIMNLPIMPGQNNNGKNGASVVSVPANTGINTSPAAIIADVGAVSLPLPLYKYPVRVFNYHDRIIYNNSKSEQ